MQDGDVVVMLARLEVKLDQLLGDSSDHEHRIRKLEERRWPLPVFSVALSAAAVVLAFLPVARG